jgi:MFS transporter, DHA1 family, multidrug resistance protein
LSGTVLGAHGVTLCLFAPIWGILADRYGRKVMVCRSMFGGAFILVFISMVRTVEQLVACRFLQGVFTGTVSASVALA